VSGQPAADRGTVECGIGRVPHAGVAGGLFAALPGKGKPASTSWRVLRRFAAPCQTDRSARAADGSRREQSGGHWADGSGLDRRPGRSHGAQAEGPRMRSDGYQTDRSDGAGSTACGTARCDLSDVSGGRADSSGGASGSALLEVEIHTGRPHQIRIHMAWAGHPLVGDPLYGRGGLPKVERLCLPLHLGFSAESREVSFPPLRHPPREFPASLRPMPNILLSFYPYIQYPFLPNILFIPLPNILLS
jgi:hypothetical protein